MTMTLAPPSTVPSTSTSARAYPLLPVCQVQQPGETLPEYAARVLRFVLNQHITASLTDEQLEQAERAGQRACSSLPATLEPADQTIAERLTEARHQIARAIRWRQEQAREATLAPAQETTEPQDDQPAPDEQARALQLLRAALTLIMDPRQDDSGGGRPAKLIKPVPKLPPSGQAITPPRPPDAIRF